MTSYVTPKKGVEFIMYLGLPSASDSSIFQANPTLAAGDVKVSIDGGAFANLTTLPAVTPAAGKAVKMTLSTAEMNGDNILVVFSDQTASEEWKDVIINIQTSARQIDDLAYPTTSGRSIDVDASGGVEVGSFQAGAITAAAIATGAIDADSLAADAGTEIGTAVWATAARTLTALDEDTTTIDLDATIAAAVPTVAAIADAVWDELIAGHAGVGSTGEALSAAGSGGTPPTAAEIADAVWDEDATAHQTQGTFGQAIGDPGADTDTIFGLVNTNLDATVSSRSSQASVDTIDTEVGVIDGIVDAILVDTGTDIPATIADLPTNAELATALGTADDAVLTAIAALNNPTVGAIADAVWDEPLAGHLTAGTTGAELNDAGAAASAPTASAIADEVETRTLDANIVQVNSIVVDGAGTEADPWGP